MNIGQKIPDAEFEVFVDNDIRKCHLSDYQGKWLVLAFYPADFTFVCPTELEELALLYPDFRKEEAEIISVSTDTAFVHMAWHASSPAIGKVKYPMAADPSLKLSRMFGTLIEEDGLSHRATFIIDPDGVLRSMDLHDSSIGRSAQEILRRVQASKYVRENPGLVCPAGWKPGAKTLKKGLDLVGKI